MLSIRAHCPIQFQQVFLWGLLYLISCFHLFWKNILSAMYADWGRPHLSLVVCYIFHLLIPLLCKIWFYKDCNRNCKNPVLDVIRTLGTSNQTIYYKPPKYLLLFVNRFRYINNNVTKDRCSIPMDTTIRLGPLRFSLRATIDHHGPSIHSGHYTSSINCCKKTFYCNDHTITEFGIIDSKDSSTAYVILYELIDIWFLDSNWRVGVWSLPCNGAGTSSPSHWQQVEEQVPKPVGWMMCFLLMTFVPVQKPCVYKHIYMPFYMSSVFFGLPIVSCPLMINNSLIPGCLWLLAFVLNNTLLLGIWCSTIPHLPGCFCPWTFFQNFGFNMVPSDPCMSHLATQLGYSAGEFQALQLIVLATFGVVD